MAKTPSAPSDAPQEGAPAVGKGRATPTRAEREAARRRPLVADTKEARARARAELSERREKARAGMAAGDERYLPARDKGPQRRYIRDYVDARWHVAEFVMPAMIVVILLTFIGIPAVQVYAFLVLWGFVILAIANMIFVSWRVKRAVRRKFGDDKLERGSGWYAAMRAMQMRFLRLPKPQVKRGTRVD